MAKKPAVKTQALVNYDAEMAKLAIAAAQVEAKVAVGNAISTRGGKLSYAGQPAQDNKYRVVILTQAFENRFYEGAFNPDLPASPVCYAFSATGDNMVPHQDSLKPQSKACAGCPNSEWGSAEMGRGKACKNVRRLAMIHEHQVSTASESGIVRLSVPVTSVAGFSLYTKYLADVHKRPLLGVVTEISTAPDPKTQFKLTFKCVSLVDREHLPAIVDKARMAARELEMPYPVIEAPPPRSKKARKF